MREPMCGKLQIHKAMRPHPHPLQSVAQGQSTASHCPDSQGHQMSIKQPLAVLWADSSVLCSFHSIMYPYLSPCQALHLHLHHSQPHTRALKR